jgi:hypothetical protein
MKTAPTIGVAESADAGVLPDLPEEIALAMSDTAGPRGLLAMRAAAGMAVMAAVFEAGSPGCAGQRANTLRRGSVQPTRFAAKGQYQ